jgi:hypothetical protein
MKFSAKNPRLRKAPKRYGQVICHFRTTMKQTLYILTLTLGLVSCNNFTTEKNTDKSTLQTFSSDETPPPPIVLVSKWTDKTVYTIINDNAINHNRSYEMLPEDLRTVEEMFSLCISEFNGSTNTDKVNPSDYKRQYVPIMNEKDEREVWINCFCAFREHNEEWKKGIIRVKDGGKCYFNLKINLSKRFYYALNFNGEA